MPGQMAFSASKWPVPHPAQSGIPSFLWLKPEDEVFPGSIATWLVHGRNCFFEGLSDVITAVDAVLNA